MICTPNTEHPIFGGKYRNRLMSIFYVVYLTALDLNVNECENMPFLIISRLRISLQGYPPKLS